MYFSLILRLGNETMLGLGTSTFHSVPSEPTLRLGSGAAWLGCVADVWAAALARVGQVERTLPSLDRQPALSTSNEPLELSTSSQEISYALQV